MSSEDLNPIERVILRREAMKYLNAIKSHWPTIAAVVAVIVPIFKPQLLHYVSAHPHGTLGVLLGCVVAAYNSASPTQQAQLAQVVQKLLAQPAAKAIAFFVVALALTIPVRAQTSPTPTPAPSSPAPLSNIYAAGISFNNAAQPAIAGTGLYARLVSPSSGTYAFTAVDVLPTSTKPFTVTTNFSAGVAQKVFTIGSVPIFVPTSAGVSFSGTNTGWAWSTGAIAPIKIKGSWRIFPTVRVARSNVSSGSGVQPIIGVLFGWGQ